MRRQRVARAAGTAAVMMRGASGEAAVAGATVPAATVSDREAAATRAAERKAAEGGIKKKYTKGGRACKVRFRLPKAAAAAATAVNLVGEFNDWSLSATRLKRLANGDFTVEVELTPGRGYRFRYLIDGAKWENDWCADRYVPNAFGGEDSVVDV